MTSAKPLGLGINEVSEVQFLVPWFIASIIHGSSNLALLLLAMELVNGEVWSSFLGSGSIHMQREQSVQSHLPSSFLH